MTNPSKSALILVEYVNHGLAPTGGINSQFRDRDQVDTAIANSKIVLKEVRRRDMEVSSPHSSTMIAPFYACAITTQHFVDQSKD
jgi:nicotinamidase-related amidase